MADKNFKVKNKLVIAGLTNSSGVLLSSGHEVDAHTNVPTQYGGTGTTTSPTSGQILYSSAGTTYSPTTLTSLDVKGATYSADAPSSPFVGQVWIESDSSSDSFDPNIMRRKTITATAGQTVFTTDFTFIDGYEQVYFNGMLLLRTTDYTTSGSSSTVTLTSAAAVNDIVEIVTITNLNSINAATTTTNTFTGAQIINDSSSSAALRITQTGTGEALRVEDSSNPDSSPFVIDASGNAGIGTNSMNAKLNVESSGTSTSAGGNIVARFQSNGSGYDSTIQLSDNIANSATISMLSGATIFRQNGGESMRIDSAGNVGIGVSSPTSKLHVETSGTNYILSRNGAAGSGIAGLILQNSGDTRGIRINGSSLELYDHSAGAARMVINASGDVGIGTSSPYYKLSVNGTLNAYSGVAGLGRIFLGDPADSNGYIGIYRSALGPANYNTAGNGLNFASIDGYVFATASPPNYIYGVQTERMRIASDGTLSLQYVDASAPVLYNTANNNNKLMIFEGYAGNRWNLWGGHGGNSYFGISENASSTPVFAITGSTNYVLVGYTTSQGAYKLQVNSQIFATSSTIATSDGRFKENVNTIESGLNIIDALRPVSFNWKEHAIHNFPQGKTVGFIAQEVQEALSDYDWKDNIIKSNISEAVLDEEGNIVHPEEEFLGIAEGNLIPLLVAAVKELKSRVETLEAANV